MTKKIEIDVGPHQSYTLEVRELDEMRKKELSLRCPVARPEEIDSMPDADLMQWYVDVIEYTTPLDENRIKSMPAHAMLTIAECVVEVAFDVDTSSPASVPEDGWLVITR